MINDSHCICWHAFFNVLWCPKYNFLCQKWFCFPSVVSHLKCIHGHSLDRTKNIFRSQHRDEAPSSILYQSYGCYSQDLVLSRRGDGRRNCLLITEHMNTINTRVIAITKKYSNADCRHDTKSANENYLFETFFWGCSTKYRLWYWASYKIALIRRQRL